MALQAESNSGGGGTAPPAGTAAADSTDLPATQQFLEESAALAAQRRVEADAIRAEELRASREAFELRQQQQAQQNQHVPTATPLDDDGIGDDMDDIVDKTSETTMDDENIIATIPEEHRGKVRAMLHNRRSKEAPYRKLKNRTCDEVPISGPGGRKKPLKEG